MSLIPTGTTVTVETKWFPPLMVELGGDATAQGPAGLVTKYLQPKVTLRYQGKVLAAVAPAGEPVPNQWPKVRIALVIAGALALFSILRIFR